MTKNSIQMNARGVYGIVLLLLLAVSGYMGAKEEAVQTVSAAITRTHYELEDTVVDSSESAKAQVVSEREQELALLRSVADDAAADEETRKEALRQITEITGRMEVESQVRTCLEEMGYIQPVCVSGAHGLTLILETDSIEEQERVRMIDAVCGIAGCEAGNIKIILTKK